MAGDRAQELVPLEGIEADLALRRDRRSPGHVAKERDLPEVVAGTHRPYLFPVGRDLNLTRVDDVEAVAVVALADDRRAAIGPHGDQARSDLVDRAHRKRFEERHRA